jgi:hypothetical protein
VVVANQRLRQRLGEPGWWSSGGARGATSWVVPRGGVEAEMEEEDDGQSQGVAELRQCRRERSLGDARSCGTGEELSRRIGGGARVLTIGGRR